LKRIFPQLIVLNVWSIIAVRIARHWGFHRLEVPLTSLSLVSGFVGVLQTLRSNQGLTRLTEARLAMGRMVLLTRDAALLISTYITPKDPVLGMRAARHLALFGWVLKSHYRETGATDIVDTLLSKQDATYVKNQRKRPVAILFRLRQIMANVADRQLVTTTEHRLIEDNIRSLDEVIMTGERIRASPVPPVYNAHATRLMLFYLFCLPMALLGSAMDSVAAIVVTMVVGFAMLGLDELSHMFEQPFKFMPLYQLSKVSMIDVADAFCRPPPPLDVDDESTAIVKKAKPMYWTRKGKDPSLPYDGAQFT
jgi:predicted membrane chloride channel (bestrophin family)